MKKWNVTDLVNLKYKERNHCNNCQTCQCCWLLCTSYGDIQNRKSMWRPETSGTNIPPPKLESSYVKKNIILQTKHYCMYKCIFSYVCSQSIDGNSVVIQWLSNVMNGPIKRLNKFVWTVIRKLDLQIWMSDTEQSKVLKVTCCCCSMHNTFLIIVDNA